VARRITMTGIVFLVASMLYGFHCLADNRAHYPSAVGGDPGICALAPPSAGENGVPRATWQRARSQSIVSQSSRWLISCLGDSITNGYPYAGTENTYPARLLNMLEEAYGPGTFEVINHGVFGYRADQVLADLQELDWMDEDPDIVLLMVGGNDLAQEATPLNLSEVIDRTVAEVQAIVDLVTAHTNADGSHPQIIVSAFIPNLVAHVWGSDAIALYNARLESNLTGVDLWITDNWDDFYDPETGQARVELMYDPVHPNVEGYIVIAENWFQAINSLLPQVYHVSTEGDDGDPGTFDAPWRTIQHAADTVQPGDTVCVHTGTYVEDVTFSRSGTDGAPITFTAAPGEAVTIQGSLTLAPNTSYLSLIGFAVQGFDIWGISLEGDNHHVLLSHLNVAGGEAGIHFTVGYSGEDPQYGPVSDVILEDSIVHGCEYTAVDCTPGPCDRMTFRRLEIYGAGMDAGFSGDGLAVERGQDILVEDCYIHDNGGDGIDLNSRDWDGNVPGIIVRRNRVVRNHLQAIKLWAGGRMENNLIWGQGINPVTAGVYTSTCEVVNNTIAYNMYDPTYSARDYAFIAAWPEIGFSPPVTLILVNNIFALNTGPAVGGPTGIYLGAGVQLIEHHNLYWSREDGEIQAEFVSGRDPWFTRDEIADGTWTAFTGQGGGDVVSDPLFTSGWPAVNLHLQEESPAIDAGAMEIAPSVDLESNPRPIGSGVDIGAYEHGASIYLPLILKDYPRTAP